MHLKQTTNMADTTATMETMPESQDSGLRIALHGMRAMTSFLISAFPMGFVGGVLGMTSGLGGGKTLALAMIANSGTAQFIAIKLLQERASNVTIVVTVLILSLRLLMYGVMLRPHVKPLGSALRALLGFFLIDAVFFAVIDRLGKEPQFRRGWPWFYLGAAGVMYVNWMLATMLGIAFASSLPKAMVYGLDFPITAVFAAMLAGSLASWKHYVAAVCAAIVAVAANALPYNTGLVLAAVVGACVASACESMQARRDSRNAEART